MEIKERLELTRQIQDELPTNGKPVMVHHGLAAELAQVGVLPPVAGTFIAGNYLAAILSGRIQELEILKGRRSAKKDDGAE
jgi:hypothetical protein